MAFTLQIGEKAPDFRLKGTDGNEHALADHADKKAVVVVFTCNHCPYAIPNEDRLIALQRDYADRGVQVIAISSNSTEHYPADSFEHMIERAREKGFNFPYLHDESQDISKAYGAQRTPEVFLFGPERTLVYHGKIDDSVQDPAAVKQHFLHDALDAVLAAQPVPVENTEPEGCNTKWLGRDPHWMPVDLASFNQ